MRRILLWVSREACLRGPWLEDCTSWRKNDRKMLARIKKLIDDVKRGPFTGIGKPVPLNYQLPGAWSRRLDDQHRLVYLVMDEEIVTLAARYLY